jgi:hypothetical protein
VEAGKVFFHKKKRPASKLFPPSNLLLSSFFVSALFRGQKNKQTKTKQGQNNGHVQIGRETKIAAVINGLYLFFFLVSHVIVER